MDFLQYSKAIGAFVGQAASMAVLFGLNPELVTPENLSLATTLVSAVTFVVYRVTNKPKGGN